MTQPNKTSVRSALVLDRGYQPILIVPWQKAFCMGYTERVEVLAVHERPVRGIDRDWQAPAVLRLLGPIRPQQYVIRFSRHAIHRRDSFTCQYCGRRPRRDELTLDHVVPRTRGGPTSWTNIVSACAPCNARKGCRSLEQARLQLRHEPSQPRWKPLSRASFGSRVPEVWRDWLR